MNEVELRNVEDSVLVKEIVRRLSLLNPDDIIHYRTEEVYQFAKMIADEISEEISSLDRLTSEFTKQKEDLEHKLCFGIINEAIDEEEKGRLTEQISDAIVLRRYTKDNRSIMSGFRDTFTRICGSIQKYNNLSYSGKSALYGEDTDGIVIRSNLNLSPSYQRRLSELFKSSASKVNEADNQSTKVLRVEATSCALKAISDNVSALVR